MLDGLSFIVIGGYVAVVVWKGNLPQLLGLLSQELGFLEWGLAVAALVAIYRSRTFGPIGQGLIALAAVGVGYKLVQSANFQAVIDKLKAGQDPLKALSSGSPVAPQTSVTPGSGTATARALYPSLAPSYPGDTEFSPGFAPFSPSQGPQPGIVPYYGQ